LTLSGGSGTDQRKWPDAERIGFGRAPRIALSRAFCRCFLVLLSALDATVILEVFRRLWLGRLHQAERLSEAFMKSLLSWVHPGFSAFAAPLVKPGGLESLQSQARYIARPAMAMDALRQRPDGTPKPAAEV
jgi:hypothetical protein